MERTLEQTIHDPERLAALRNSRLLDTPPEEAFDQLTRIAARLLQAPVALVSLVDANRQFFKSCMGPMADQSSERETPLSHSFCKYTLETRDPLIIRDAREHPLTRENPAVLERNVIAYAGVPLITAEGHVLGTLCVVDAKPRDWTDEQIQKLRSLAANVMAVIADRTMRH